MELVPDGHVWGSLTHCRVGSDWVRHWPAVWKVCAEGTVVFST